MFALQEEIGGSAAILDAVYPPDNADCSAAVGRIAAVLAEQGELLRRYMGYDPEPIADVFAQRIAFPELLKLRRAIPEALLRGFHREVKGEESEIDLGLAELNAQKENETAQAHFIRTGTAAGLTKKEVLLSTPGEIMDLWEVYLQSSGLKRRRDIGDE